MGAIRMLAATAQRGSLSAFWPLERREAPAEATVAVRGRVEIRWLRAGCVARTCVKGGQAAAFGTALARLRRYAHGDNHHGLHLVTARSALQWQVAPGRWLVGVRLNDIEAAHTAPVARTPKIALIWTEPEFLAVVRVHGRPTSDRIERGDTIVLNALANSEWLVSGVPMIRLHKCGLVRWLTRGFEVVVPVAERRSNSVMRNTRLPGRPDPAVTPGSGRATRSFRFISKPAPNNLPRGDLFAALIINPRSLRGWPSRGPPTKEFGRPQCAYHRHSRSCCAWTASR